MLFNSLTFLVFFLVVTTGYFVLPHRHRWFLLLAASCYFYMYFIPKYILILAVTIIVDYFAGMWIAGSQGKRRRLYLVLSLVTNIGFLGFFKYFNFFNENAQAIASALGLHYPIPALQIILPIGLSFHTFQAMAYTIEVYRGSLAPERNFGLFALYVMFYPQLVAGPIERPQNLLHQFREEHFFDYGRALSGLRLMGWGLFKKVVVADRLADYVNVAFANPAGVQPAGLVLATFFFTFQIYCDFSGYSDIALGSARVMGFTLMKNFDCPYVSQSVGEFWKRWHISLSTWFKDYLYIPLGGSRVAPFRHHVNLMITFLVSGLWHGANWTYTIWGGLNGFYLVLSSGLDDVWRRIAAGVGLTKAPGLLKGGKIAITFVLISLAWVFFRATSLHDALVVVRRLPLGVYDLVCRVPTLLAHRASGSLEAVQYFKEVKLGFGWDYFVMSILVLAVMECIQWRMRNPSTLNQWFETRCGGWVTAIALVYGILFLGSFNSNQQFIYFQF
jgi:D-alanyl-lipoteichoic acid acyltransferase DltB (MBOAT superfamily)